MHKVLIDTNVWVDVILGRPAFAECSKGAILACIEDEIEMILPATSLKDIFYFACKSAGADAGYRALDLVMQQTSVAAVDTFICHDAINRERPDFEDGIVAACALAEHAEAVITRDDAAFCDLGIPKYSPEGFLAALGYEPIPLA